MKYLIVGSLMGSDSVEAVVDAMSSLHISHERAFFEGVDKDEIMEINKVAIEREMIIFAAPKEKAEVALRYLRENMESGEYIPLREGVNPNLGVYIPVVAWDGTLTGSKKPVSVKLEGRPSRGVSIGGRDEKALSELLKKDMDVDSFIKTLEFLD